MKALNSALAIFLYMMLSPALAGVEKNISPDTGIQGCRVQLTDLVTYLKETAEIEGIALSIEHTENEATLIYPEFVQHMQCVNAILQIDIRDPGSN